MLPVRKARKLPLFLRFFDGRGNNGSVAQGDHVLHDAVGDLDGIALALFGWFNHAASLTCRGRRAKRKFKVAHYRIRPVLRGRTGGPNRNLQRKKVNRSKQRQRRINPPSFPLKKLILYVDHLEHVTKTSNGPDSLPANRVSSMISASPRGVGASVRIRKPPGRAVTRT